MHCANNKTFSSTNVKLGNCKDILMGCLILITIWNVFIHQEIFIEIISRLMFTCYIASALFKFAMSSVETLITQRDVLRN